MKDYELTMAHLASAYPHARDVVIPAKLAAWLLVEIDRELTSCVYTLEATRPYEPDGALAERTRLLRRAKRQMLTALTISHNRNNT